MEDATDARIDVAVDKLETGHVQSGRPRMLLRASCEPSRMATPSFEKMEMATIAHVTYAGKDWNERKSFTGVETLCFNTKATSAPELTKAEMFNGESSDIVSETYADKCKIRRTQSTQMPSKMNVDDVDYARQTKTRQEKRRQCITDILGRGLDRLFGILDIPLILVFGIILYVVDVGSDVTAGIVYYQEGHPVWASLTIMCVVLSAVCWAAVSWTWWYYSDDKDKQQTYRRMRMMLAVLLLDPLVRYVTYCKIR